MNTNNSTLPVYRIHPGIGIARVGDSPDGFCLSPEKPAALPTDCDALGNARLSPDGQTELPIKQFKDAQGRIKRQAARCQIYVYDEDNPAGRPLRLGDAIKGGGNHGTLVDIQWQVYLANKKAEWYEFDALAGEHGYGPKHQRRNADITDAEARQQLIIDPGPQVVESTDERPVPRQVDPGLLTGLPRRGVGQGRVAGLLSSSGKSDLTTPRISRIIGALDEQQLRASAAAGVISAPKDQRDGRFPNTLFMNAFETIIPIQPATCSRPPFDPRVKSKNLSVKGAPN